MTLNLKKYIFNIVNVNNYEFKKKITVNWLLFEL